MAITAAEVESNGWVLALTLTGSLTSPATDFGAYPLDPDGTPKLALALSSPGFVKSGGQAVAGSNARELVGTRALRKPIDPLNPTQYLIDETDLGGGSIKVRIVLSEEVYVGDTGLTLAALAGWRTGEGAASGISVTNNSTLAPPLPVFRWVLPPYEVTAGVFRASILVGTVNPFGFEPLAGVKFTATDGTTTKTVWATALATDNTYGDNLRCYTVEFDPAAGTALTAGLLRIDAELYPWLGAMRTTDPAGTKAMTNMRTAAYGQSAESPWCIGYDPAGTRYGQQWLYVDPVNGTLTANATMVCTSLAAAKAISPASRPKSVSTALQAIYLQNRTLAAANGQASASRAADGATIVMAVGTHTGFNGTSVTTGLNPAEIPVRIIGDPDDSNPRANCLINTGTAASATRCARMRFQNLTVQTASSAALNDAGTTFAFLDNVEVRGATSFEGSSTFPIATAAPGSNLNWYVTRSKFWRLGTTLSNANRWTGLVRACEHSRRVAGVCYVKNRHISKAEDGFTAANTVEGFGTATTSVLAAMEDLVVGFNDFRSMRYAALALNAAPAAISGVSPQLGRQRRHLILNNLFERISTTGGVSTTSDSFFGYGETAYNVMDTIIFEGNTIAGGAYNAFYNDPVPSTLADVDSQTNIAVRIRHANNATDRNASKHDDFFDPAVNSIRAAAGPPESLKGGYRPVATGAWSVHFGVNMEGHVDFSRKGSVNFRRDGGSGFVGRRGVQYPYATPGSPLYANDRSEAGNDLGGGDYTPQAGSPLLGRAFRANSDRDFLNSPRLSGGASGAIESGAINLAAASITIDISVAVATLAATPSLAPAALTVGISLAAGVLSATAGLSGAALSLPAALGESVIIASLTLVPDAVALAFTVATAGLIVSAGFPEIPPPARTIIVRGL